MPRVAVVNAIFVPSGDHCGPQRVAGEDSLMRAAEQVGYQQVVSPDLCVNHPVSRGSPAVILESRPQVAGRRLYEREWNCRRGRLRGQSGDVPVSVEHGRRGVESARYDDAARPAPSPDRDLLIAGNPGRVPWLRLQVDVVRELDLRGAVVVQARVVVVAECEEFEYLCPIGIVGVGNRLVVKEPASAAVQRRARISKQSESQLPVVAAIGVHCPHNCRASLLRSVPGTDEVDGSASGVAAATTAWGHAEDGGTG